MASSYPKAISALAFSSSFHLDTTNCPISGWSAFKITILAALRVFPPERIVPAIASAPFIKDTGPEDFPRFEIFSLDERSGEIFTPEPEPPAKINISVRYHSAMDSLSSVMDKIKQAEHWGFFSTPTLNQTGELNEAYWLANSHLSSSLKICASFSPAK